MARRNNSATISELKKVNKDLEEEKSWGNGVKYRQIGQKEELFIISVGDILLKIDEKVIGNFLLIVKDKGFKRACRIY